MPLPFPNLNGESEHDNTNRIALGNLQLLATCSYIDITHFSKMIRWATKVNKSIAPLDFPDTLHFLMKERNMTVELLEERSQISVRTIKRLRNDPNYNVTREHIVALSVGLELPPIISMELLRKAGLTMKNTALQNAYSMILCIMYSVPIETVNGFLISLGIPPLTKLATRS